MVIYLLQDPSPPLLLGVVKDPSTGDKVTVDRVKIIDDQGRVSNNGENVVKILELAFNTLSADKRDLLLSIINDYIGQPLIFEYASQQFTGVIDTTTLEVITKGYCSYDLTIQIFVIDTLVTLNGWRVANLNGINQTRIATLGRVGNRSILSSVSGTRNGLLTRLGARTLSTQINRTRAGSVSLNAARTRTISVTRAANGLVGRSLARTSTITLSRTSSLLLGRNLSSTRTLGLTRTAGLLLGRNLSSTRTLGLTFSRYFSGIAADVDTQPFGGGASTDLCLVLSTYASILVEITGSSGWTWGTFSLTGSTYSSGMQVPGNGWTANVRGWEGSPGIGTLTFDLNINGTGGPTNTNGAEVKIGGRKPNNVVEQIASIQFQSATTTISQTKRIVVNTVGAWNA